MKVSTADGFQNLLAGMGVGADNLQSRSTYTFNYWTRNRALLEAMYRGSWVVAKAVNIIADDMTRAGVDITWPGNEEAPDKLNRAFRRRHLWSRMNTGLRWARLFGGALGVMMIDGHDPSTPLDLRKIGRNQFKGLHIVDRWIVTPSTEIVKDFGAHFGKPVSYQIASGNNVPFAGQTIHYTRVIRFEGLELPYFQKLAEMGWGMSVVEPLYDRMVAFDTATAGTANLIHKAHLRVVKIKDLRSIIGQSGPAGNSPMLAGVVKFLNMIREMQTNEGLTLLDQQDEFEAHNYTFSGLSDVVWQFAQQVCGAIDVPLVRFFGASPGGLGSNGDAELRNHYDKINQDQEHQLRDPTHDLIVAVSLSEGLGLPPDDMDFGFRPLWQLSDSEKADIAAKDTNTILAAHEASLVSDQQALRELQISSRVTGLWSTISDKDIQAAEDQIPDPMDVLKQQTEITAGAETKAKLEPEASSEQVGE